MDKKIVIIGMGEVGKATAHALPGLKSYHDPVKGFRVNNFNHYDVAIVCVDTPHLYSQDHQALENILISLQSCLYKGKVVIRSTLSMKFLEHIENYYNLNIVEYQEYMREVLVTNS